MSLSSSPRRSVLTGSLFVVLALTHVPGAQGSDPPQPRIVGGSQTTAAQYPWQAALVEDARFTGTAFNRHFCGGTFITSRIVQTAAHCVYGDPDCATDCPTNVLEANDVDVIGGRTQLTTSAGQQFNVQQVYLDPDYDTETGSHDLAWLVLATAATDPNIKVIDIAGPAESAFWDPASPTEVSGWGDTTENGTGSDLLKRALVPIVPEANCVAQYDDWISASMLCAADLAGGNGDCQGDSGGPLVGPSTTAGEVRLVGLVSFGEGCARPNVPGGYVRIAAQPEFDIQATVNFIETDASPDLPDGGSVYGAGGLVPAPNIAPVPPATTPAVVTPNPMPAQPKQIHKKRKKKKKKKKK